MQDEIELYRGVQEGVLKLVKINEQIWNSSMDTYLPSGAQYITKALKQSLKSPFNYTLNNSEEEVLQTFLTSAEWALDIITK